MLRLPAPAVPAPAVPAPAVPAPAVPAPAVPAAAAAALAHTSEGVSWFDVAEGKRHSPAPTHFLPPVQTSVNNLFTMQKILFSSAKGSQPCTFPPQLHLVSAMGLQTGVVPNIVQAWKYQLTA
ncbi:hypothetical protein FHG87_018290 [Trinorchestia longiramus]|nr:hypothetical protein FHG87_018290 [Trinorchestia longiramus]